MTNQTHITHLEIKLFSKYLIFLFVFKIIDPLFFILTVILNEKVRMKC